MTIASASGRNQRVALSVIAPCLNEEGNIHALCDRVLAMFVSMGISGELVLVDDGSRDRTWELIERRMNSDARVCGVRHDINRGIVAGWRSGLAAACGELVCLIDSDLQNPPESIEALYRRYQAGGVDLVQGARIPEDYVMMRLALSKGLNFLLNRVFGMRLRDNKSGFVLSAPSVLHDALGYHGRYRFAQCFITVFAHARGYRVGEVATPFHPRHAGTSFLANLPFRVVLRIFWEIARARMEFTQLRREAKAHTSTARRPLPQPG